MTSLNRAALTSGMLPNCHAAPCGVDKATEIPDHQCSTVMSIYNTSNKRPGYNLSFLKQESQAVTHELLQKEKIDILTVIEPACVLFSYNSYILECSTGFSSVLTQDYAVLFIYLLFFIPLDAG